MKWLKKKYSAGSHPVATICDDTLRYSFSLDEASADKLKTLLVEYETTIETLTKERDALKPAAVYQGDWIEIPLHRCAAFKKTERV